MKLLPLLALAAGMSLPLQASAESFAAPGENLALHRTYTLEPPPSYALCTDEGDATQLTDGAYTQGHFWSERTTVGWIKARVVVIKLDLGSVCPIAGVSFSTAARGAAGVEWPAAIYVYVSDDARQWWEAGEVVSLSGEHGQPPAHALSDDTVRHRFRTDRLRARGRYVGLVVGPGGDYAFCDEVEVYRGPDALMKETRRGRPLRNLSARRMPRLPGTSVHGFALADAAGIRQELAAARLPEDERARLESELDAALSASKGEAVPPLTLYPLSRAHARTLGVRGRLWRARGLPELSVWQCGRWDPLDPAATPPEGAPPPRVDVTLLRGEVRSAVLNLTNASGRAKRVRVSFAGVPGGPRPGWITVHPVAWTMLQGRPVAAALPEAKRAGHAWEVEVPAGMTRQVWLSVASAGLAAGTHSGSVVLSGGSKQATTVPLRVRVSPVALPEHLSLALGGWDYVDGPQLYHISAPNRARLIAFLKRYRVDAPWATGQVMPFGRHAVDGRMVAPPDTSSMDEWLDIWKGARLYCVFNNFEGVSERTPAGFARGTPAWQRVVGEWITFWVRHLARRGIAPSQLYLLLVDEPRNPATDQRTVVYARAIRAAQPEVVLWTDPIWDDPRRASPELYEVCTVLCPQRPMWLANPRAYEEVFLAQQKAGKALQFYSCSGPARGLDPYTYHRLQAWDCFRWGMDAEFFWSFGGGGGTGSWNELRGGGFTPQLLGPEGCTTGKQMEAIREGRQDYEYLVMLRDRIARAERSGAGAELLARPKALLAEAPTRVLGAPGASHIAWSAPKDRDLADTVRLEVLDMIERLDLFAR